MKSYKWKLALVATVLDLVYLSSIIFLGHHEGSAGNFWGSYLPFFLHFPFSWLFWGVSSQLVFLLFPIQTFFIFWVVGFGIEKNKKALSLVIVSVFYALLIGVAVKTSWDERTREAVNVVLPTGFKGVVSILLDQPNGETIPLTGGKYVVEIPKDGQKVLANDLSGLRPYVFNYKDGNVVPYDPENPKATDIACFDLNERNNERKFFIGTKKDHEEAEKNN